VEWGGGRVLFNMKEDIVMIYGIIALLIFDILLIARILFWLFT